VFLGNRTALLRFLRARGAGDDAEDLVQELWVKAKSAPAGPISEPLAYLYRMADRHMLDHRRSMLRRQRREETWASGPGDAGEVMSGERQIFARDELGAAEAVLAELGERTEFIFRRFRVEGRPQSEIAEEIGISLSAVEKHLQKAYRALLRWKEASGNDDPGRHHVPTEAGNG